MRDCVQHKMTGEAHHKSCCRMRWQETGEGRADAISATRRWRRVLKRSNSSVCYWIGTVRRSRVLFRSAHVRRSPGPATARRHHSRPAPLDPDLPPRMGAGVTRIGPWDAAGRQSCATESLLRHRLANPLKPAGLAGRGGIGHRLCKDRQIECPGTKINPGI